MAEQPARGPDHHGLDSTTADHHGGIVIFDGDCAFCCGAVGFIARRDPSGYLRFSHATSPTAQRLLSRHGIDRATTQSLVLIESGHACLRSTASLRIAARLAWPWHVLGVLLWVPAPLRDAVYRGIARARHHLGGTAHACAPLPPDVRERLI